MIIFSRTIRLDQRGAAVIELALVAPILAVMIIGVVDMSNGYSRKLALEQGSQRAIEKVDADDGSRHRGRYVEKRGGVPGERHE